MKRPKQFYYIIHRDNLKSVLKSGVLSRSKSEKGLLAKIGFLRGIKSIHSKEIVSARKRRLFKDRSLWDYANVYFQARNPMLFSVIREYGKENIIVLQISPDILNIPGAGVTDGNGASKETQLFDAEQGLSVLSPEQFERRYWGKEDGSKRTIMAEALVPDRIPKEKIIGIYTADSQTADQIRKETTGPLNIMPNPDLFFLPDESHSVSDRLSLKKGDMFFSNMQTFTISVNTVGVMGKGLASRAKYQFPDVYVKYQDLCRSGKLKMGIPHLYKREEDYEKTLFEDGRDFRTENGKRWFLLFPTKNHWREKSPLEGIERGLQQLSETYKDQGIESLALPALGCGLGGLDWKEAGPLMCRHLQSMNIQSCIYLPLERPVPAEQREPQFLLKG